jgi:hypothetical protein
MQAFRSGMSLMISLSVIGASSSWGQTAPTSAAPVSNNPFYTSDVICTAGAAMSAVGLFTLAYGIGTNKPSSVKANAKEELARAQRIQDNFKKNVVEYTQAREERDRLIGARDGAIEETRQIGGDQFAERVEAINNRYNASIDRLTGIVVNGEAAYKQSLAEAIRASSTDIARYPSEQDLERATEGFNRRYSGVINSIRRAKSATRYGAIILIVGQIVMVLDDKVSDVFNAQLPSLKDIQIRNALSETVSEYLQAGTAAVRSNIADASSVPVIGPVVGKISYCGSETLPTSK